MLRLLRPALGAGLSCLALGVVACQASEVDGLEPPSAAVRVLPDSATLARGEVMQFRATVLSGSGARIEGQRLAWASSGGFIDSTGAFHAPDAGLYRVVARASDGLADTATVVVRDSSASTSPLIDECLAPRAGWIWCDDFERDRLRSYFEHDSAGGRFTRVAGVGTEGSTGMRSIFATTPQTSSGSLHLAFGRTPQRYFRPVDSGTANHREIYWRVFIRHSAGWQGGGGDKLSRATSFVSGTSWAQSMIAHVWSGHAAPGNDYLYLDPASGTDESGTLRTTTYNDFANLRWLGNQQGRTALFAPSGVGRWYCVEAHVRLNDPGQSNGVFELWLDDRLDASRTALNWVGRFDAFGINAVFIENFWNSGAPVAQERYLDNLVVSTQRIGCAS